MNEKIKILEERISAEEYISFLKRTDLGVDRAYTGQGIGKQLTRMQLGSMRSLAWIF